MRLKYKRDVIMELVAKIYMKRHTMVVYMKIS